MHPHLFSGLHASADRAQRVRAISWLVVIALAFAVLIAATVGLILGPPDRGDTPMVGHSGETDAPDPGEESRNRPPSLPQVSQTADPERFAESVASAIFAWDTTDGYLPNDYVKAVLDQAADPKNLETNGLAQDLAAYLPTKAAWVELQKYQTSQALSIDRIYVPDSWEKVEAQAHEDALIPGTIGYTVEGTRHRSGVWEGEHVQTEHPVAFSLFFACEPSYERCRLLRLTQLDKPLT